MKKQDLHTNHFKQNAEQTGDDIFAVACQSQIEYKMVKKYALT